MSSVAGLIIIAVWGIARLRRRTPEPVPQSGPRRLRPATRIALPGCLALAALAITLVLGAPEADGLRLFVERIATTGAAHHPVWLAVTPSIVAPKPRDTPGIR